MKKNNSELEKVIEELNQKYKKNLVFTGNKIKIEKESTGLLSLDELMGGGLPIGKWSMIYGSKSSGKTSLCYYIMSQFQKRKKKILYIDAEHSYDENYATSFGVETKDLYVVTPSTLEESITAVRDLAPYVGLIVVDSIVAVGSEQEITRDLEKETMALIPRKLSQFFRIATPIIGKSNAVVLLINQTRMDLGAYVPIERYPGGNALAHYMSFILKLRRANPDDFPYKVVDKKKVQTGIRVVARVDKSKIAPTENKEMCFDLLYDSPHIDPVSDLLFVAEMKGLIVNTGAWFYFEDQKFQGREKVLEELRTNKTFFETLEKRLKGV